MPCINNIAFSTNSVPAFSGDPVSNGEEIAKITQLLIEYNPAPPFDTGSPEKAGTELVEKAMLFMQGMMPTPVLAH